MSGWCQTLLLDSQKSLLFLCKREVLSRRECFRTLIYLEMTQLFSTLSSLSLAQDRNSGNQNTWRNDCMFSSVQWLSRVWLFGTPWPAGRWASVSITNSRGLLKLMSIESVMPSNHLILCRPLLLLPSTFPSITVFPSESALCLRWPKYWSFSFRISPSNEYSVLISFRIDWLDLLVVQGTLKSLL